MRAVAIITARGGSKRIPRKNIKDFLGKPMLAYPLQAALDSGIFEEVMVSTEDAEIADTAKKFGAQVPFMRNPDYADDFSGTDEVVLHVLQEYEKKGRSFDAVCCIYPCSPMLTGQILAQAWRRFLDSGAWALMPVARYSQPVQRALVADEDGFLHYREPEKFTFRSQDLEPVYYDAGMFYFVQNDILKKRKRIAGSRMINFVLDEKFVQDIDNPVDWEMAEIKYRLLHKMQG